MTPSVRFAVPRKMPAVMDELEPSFEALPIDAIDVPIEPNAHFEYVDIYYRGVSKDPCWARGDRVIAVSPRKYLTLAASLSSRGRFSDAPRKSDSIQIMGLHVRPFANGVSLTFDEAIRHVHEENQRKANDARRDEKPSGD